MFSGYFNHSVASFLTTVLANSVLAYKVGGNCTIVLAGKNSGESFSLCFELIRLVSDYFFASRY